MKERKAKATKPDALRHAWSAEPQVIRPGPRKTLTIEELVEAGIVLYDTEGHQGFSLAKLAASLHLTTNALYRYVASREELEALIRDAALGTAHLSLNGSWEDNVRIWARSLMERYAEHRWLAHLPVRIPFTPNAIGWLEALLVVLKTAGLDRHTRLNAATFVDSHVRACAIAAFDQAKARGLAAPEDFKALLFERKLLSVAELVEQGQYVEIAAEASEMLDFGLETFLLGLRGRLSTSHDIT